jgi:16S rRNA (cytosine1402-N4)-methyltransferase
MEFPPSQHLPVLVGEVLSLLNPQPGQIFADGTLGGGGHTRLLAERVGPTGLVVALDRDPSAIAAAESALAGLPVLLATSDFCDLPEILASQKIQGVQGILLDLGWSSDQLADPKRGFSFQVDGPLDLRFNPQQGQPAWRLVERMTAQQLANLILRLGEERHSRRIARAVVEARRRAPLRSSAQLAELVWRAVPASARNQRIHPATRTFQALRIAVNHELESLESALRRLPDCLCSDGRLAIISFHSLEDRRVKGAFRGDARLEVITRRPIRPRPEEVAVNPRCRSARLRAARRRMST